METGATFSPCRRWRYSLWRIWSKDARTATFIGLNPSTADETQDDPTIRRCIAYARAWAYGGVIMVNLFALRSTDPKVLYQHANPVGGYNDATILDVTRDAGIVVAAWGAHGELRGEGSRVVAMLDEHGVRLHCLGTTKGGHPKHPLYLRADLQPVPYPPVGSLK